MPPAASSRISFLGLLAVALWIVLSLAWSLLLIHSAFEQTMAQRLGIDDRATHIADALRDRLVAAGYSLEPLAPPPDHGEGPATRAHARPIPELDAYLGLPALQRLLETESAHDPQLTYIMFWDTNGHIISHSLTSMLDARLNADETDDLQPAPAEAFHLLRAHPVRWAPGTPAATHITVRVRLALSPSSPATAASEPSAETTIGYVTLGFAQSWITTQFWHTQRALLLLAAAITACSSAGLLFAFSFARRRLLRAREHLEQTTRARTSLLTERGMLASVLAHEVRSPLTALRFNLYTLRSLLAAGPPPLQDNPRPMQLADSCEREIRRLDLMLTDFLTRTQVISPPENTSVNQVVNQALDFLRPTLERQNIRVITHLDPREPRVPVNGDELRQVLLNLAANAQDAMAKKRDRASTLAVSTVAEESTVTLLVRDNGVGIPLELQDRIFEPFFSTKPQGSGLGLALVRRVVSGAGGTIHCESAPNHGTTFRLSLPRSPEHTAEPAPVPAASAPETPAAQPTPETPDPAPPAPRPPA